MAASCCHPQPVVETVNTKLIMAATLTHKPLQWNTHTQTHRNTHCVSVYSRQQKLWWLHSRCHWGDLYWRDSRQNVRVCMCACVCPGLTTSVNPVQFFLAQLSTESIKSHLNDIIIKHTPPWEPPPIDFPAIAHLVLMRSCLCHSLLTQPDSTRILSAKGFKYLKVSCSALMN